MASEREVLKHLVEAVERLSWAVSDLNTDGRVRDRETVAITESVKAAERELAKLTTPPEAQPMKRNKKVVSAVHDGVGRRVSLKYADGTELRFDEDGAVIGDPLQVVQDAEGFDDGATLWVDDGDGGLWLACNLGDLRRTLTKLARPNR